MEEKELRRQRNKAQSITNMLDKDFTFMWDGLEYTIEKGETQQHPFYLAEHGAFHMARQICLNEKIDFHQNVGKVVDKILGKEFVEYNKLSKKQAIRLAEERKISLVDKSGEEKTLKDLKADLKATH